MRTAAVLVVVISVIVHSNIGQALRVQKRYDGGNWQVESAYQQQEDKSYNTDSGLRSIAHGSENRARSVVANQYAAARQAAYIAQHNLAQQAAQEAATAQAALAGKEILYKDLAKQIEEAQDALAEEKKQQKLAEGSVDTAKKAAESADKQATALADAIKAANSAAQQAKVAAEKAAAELASQSSMVGKAQERLNALEAQWSLAEVDYEATRQSTEKTSATAQAARDNASLAKAYTSQKLQTSVWKREEKSRPQQETLSSTLYRHLHRL